MLTLKQDPVFLHSTLNNLINSVTLQVLFKNKRETIWDQPKVVNIIESYKGLAQALQRAWWGAEAPPLYRAGDMKYLNASEELDELLSFDLFEKAPRGEEEVWRSWFITQPTWSIIRNAIVAYNNVLSEMGPSGDLRTAQRYVLTLVNWFQIFVRTDPTLHQRLKEHLLGFYGTKEEAMKEYERYLDILRRFTILKAIGEVDAPEDVSSKSEISSSESSVPISVLAALGVGGVLLLWKARS